MTFLNSHGATNTMSTVTTVSDPMALDLPVSELSASPESLVPADAYNRRTVEMDAEDWAQHRGGPKMLLRYYHTLLRRWSIAHSLLFFFSDHKIHR